MIDRINFSLSDLRPVGAYAPVGRKREKYIAFGEEYFREAIWFSSFHLEIENKKQKKILKIL